MSTTIKAALLNVTLPGVGYLYYKIPQRQTVGVLLTMFTVAGLTFFLYTLLNLKPDQATFHWSQLLNPGRLALRTLIGLDTYFSMTKMSEKK